jgi:DNA-binding NarL/FixJ family response regulator
VDNSDSTFPHQHESSFLIFIAQRVYHLVDAVGQSSMGKNIKVLIAEDHDVVREGLKILISADSGIEIAGEANNGAVAVRLACKLQPDVVLMDLAMPKVNGLQATREIRQKVPHSKVLVLSAYKDEETLQRVLAAGVSGYITKHSAAEELLTAIRELSKGNSYFSPVVSGKTKIRQRRSMPRPKLTRRESEVLRLIARGQPNKEIAYTLGISIKTIEKHRQAVMDKLDLHDIASLTRYAMAKGLVGATPPVQQTLPLTSAD